MPNPKTTTVQHCTAFRPGWHRVKASALHNITAQYNNPPTPAVSHILGLTLTINYQKFSLQILPWLSFPSILQQVPHTRDVTVRLTPPRCWMPLVLSWTFYTLPPPWTHRPLELRTSINTEDIRTVSPLQIMCSSSHGKLANGPPTQERGTLRLLDLLKKWRTADA